MSKRRFITLALLAGLLVPILWFLTHWVFLRGDPVLSKSIMEAFYLDRVLLGVWPSSVLLMADPEGRSISIPIVSTLANVVLYGCLGWLVWFGLYRYRAALGLAAAAVVVGWYFLFSWYAGG
jgi:hypothetical protein